MVKPTLKDIESFISDIPDPEIPVITIKELGILRGIDFVDNNYVVTITPTYTACPAMGLIEGQVKEHLAKHGITNVKVNRTYSPAWTTDWMTEDTKKKLRNYGIAPPQYLACSKSLNTNMKIRCPRCNSVNTKVISYFGSTACKALYGCLECKEPFEYFKCH
ncbi:MAG: 1,2-phenylacetyl-CoA epoxidase subunit PaaD [Bacteroidia bacterium]